MTASLVAAFEKARLKERPVLHLPSKAKEPQPVNRPKPASGPQDRAASNRQPLKVAEIVPAESTPIRKVRPPREIDEEFDRRRLEAHKWFHGIVWQFEKLYEADERKHARLWALNYPIRLKIKTAFTLGALRADVIAWLVDEFSLYDG